MKTYIISYQTNYGNGTAIINATTEENAKAIADATDTIWDGYEIELLPLYGGLVYTH